MDIQQQGPMFPQPSLLKKWTPTLVVLIGSMLIALQSGTPNAFNTIAEPIQNDNDLSDGLMSLLSSFGIIGLFFTIPAGIMNDRVGAFWTSLVGAVLTATGYMAMSFTNKDSYPAMVITFMIAGFGCGASFMAALAEGIKAIDGKPGIGVALVGGCMSLSLALTNQLVTFYKNAFDCKEDHCWPAYVRTLACASVLFMYFPTFSLIWAKPPPSAQKRHSHRGESDALLTIDSEQPRSDLSIPAYGRSEIRYELAQCSNFVERYNIMQRVASKEPVSLAYSTNILKNIFFWLVIYGYFAGIGAALLIITTTKELWTGFTKGDYASWSVNISTAFSFATLFGNLASGWACDFLWERFRISRHRLLAVLLLLFAVVYGVMAGISYIPGHDTTGIEIIFMLLMISIGVGFGSFLSLFPIIVGDYYGHVNFGLWFGYVQIGSCAATFVVPNLANAIKSAMGDFNVMMIIMAAFLATSAVGIFFKKPTPIGFF